MKTHRTLIWHNHAKGVFAVLRLRGEGQFFSEEGRQLFVWLNAQLMLKDITYGTRLANENPPDWIFNTAASLQQSKVLNPTVVRLLRDFRAYEAMPALDPDAAAGLEQLA